MPSSKGSIALEVHKALGTIRRATRDLCKNLKGDVLRNLKMSFQRLCKGIENLSLIFLVHRENKYSVYTLLSSLEKHQLHGEISIYLARVNSPETLLQDQAVHQMLSEVRGAAEKYGKVILAISLMTTSLYEHLHMISRLNELKQKLGNL
ncbi:MAG TPA: hypothetical protein ENF82_01920, partial [Candidatus Methanomethylia archaeon]|nr:hypothetical protein [Candidatus Methanomethylicia archaeon]